MISSFHGIGRYPTCGRDRLQWLRSCIPSSNMVRSLIWYLKLVKPSVPPAQQRCLWVQLVDYVKSISNHSQRWEWSWQDAKNLLRGRQFQGHFPHFRIIRYPLQFANAGNNIHSSFLRETYYHSVWLSPCRGDLVERLGSHFHNSCSQYFWTVNKHGRNDNVVQH